MDQRLNLRLKTIKLYFEENKGVNLRDLRLGSIS